MRKRLTLTIDQDIYEGLQKTVGKRNISRFIQELLRPRVINPDLDEAYAAMAKDRRREAQAAEWQSAARDPLFIKDLHEVAAGLGNARVNSTRPSAPTPDTR